MYHRIYSILFKINVKYKVISTFEENIILKKQDVKGCAAKRRRKRTMKLNI